MAGSVAARELNAASVGRGVADRAGGRATEVSLATPDDDAGLRALLRRVVMPGPIRVAFTREPAYAAGEGVAGAEDFTVVARTAGQVVGLGRLGVRAHCRNGEVQRVGYLGELRVAPGTAETPRLLRDGFACLEEAVAGASLEACYTNIVASNARAQRVLERGGRLGLPRYRPLAELVTLVVPVRRADRDAHAARASDDTAAPAPELLDFLRAHARGAHLALAWTDEQFADLARHGVTAHDFCVIRRAGRIVAAGAVWDQRPFRQTIIDGYGGALRLTRPAVNAVQSLRGLPYLPPPGAVLAQGAVLGAFAADAGAWPPLWRALRARAAARGLAWLAWSADARAPEVPALRRLLRPREYHTRIYDVAWGGRPARDAWDDRLFRPEAGLL